MPLSTDALLRAVIGLARDVHRLRTVEEVLTVAGAGLEALGFDVVVLGLAEGHSWLRYASPREPLLGLVQRLGLSGPSGRLAALPNPLSARRDLGPAPLLVEDLPAALAAWLRALPGQPEPPVGLRARAVAAPLQVGAQAWGGLVFMHDDLGAAHADILSLFAFQLGSVMDLAEQYGRLDRSTAELERTQAELVRHERLAAVGELAAVMAHEVRNPLTVIFNALAALKRLSPRPSTEAQGLLDIVDEEARRLDRIVSDLLDFVRPYVLVKRPVQVRELLGRAVAAAAPALRTSAVAVTFRVPETLPDFPADAHLLEQAALNLVVNAAQAMPRGGTLQLSASLEPRPDGAWLRLDFRDEGKGLDARAQEKLFQPFFTTRATGTGLGLAVVKRIVDGHQGEVTAAPNPGQKGTTFTIRLPPWRERDGGFTPPASPAAPPVPR